MDTTKLLVIDDERPILEMLEISLTSEGYDVHTAENGKEGLKLFEARRPRLVLTDIKMPGIDGIEVLKRVKSIDEDAEVIVITGHGDMDSAVAAIRHGASDFITKPIRDEILMLALKRAQKKIAINDQLKDYTNNLEQKVDACRLELQQAQEELMKNERLATIGETVAGLAHFIKNILTGLRGGRYMVNKGMAGDNPGMLREGWSMVERNIERVSELVLDLLRYSKERVPERKACNPNEIVEEAVKLYEDKAAEHGISLKTVLDARLKEAFIDREGIYRALLNLISNAIDACIYDPDPSKAWEVSVGTRLEGDDHILFEVRDNGIGMTDEVKAKLFTRFYSTKGGHGTGLGLLITQKIITEHEGKIWVESEKGRGTTFFVRLQRSMPPDPSTPSQ